MILPSTVIASVLPVYLLIVAGAVLRKLGVVREEHDAGVLQLANAVMLPCFILDKILGSAVLKSGTVVLWSMGLGFGMILVGLLTGWLVGRLIGLKRGAGMRTFALSAGCQNFGFTAVPVVEILWGTGALALLFVHNIGVVTAIWSVGVMVLCGERGLSWRKLINGPVVAVTIGLILVAMGVDSQVTGAGRKAISMIGVGAFPVSILITGCTMVDLIRSERPDWRVIVGSSLVRLGLVPLAILSAAKYLPLSTELRQVLVVQAAMPAGMTSIMMTQLYGGRTAVAIQIVTITTVLSFLTLPWIIAWGSDWVGLKAMLP